MEERLRRLSQECDSLLHVMAFYDICRQPIELFEWPADDQHEKEILKSLTNSNVTYNHILANTSQEAANFNPTLAKRCLIWLQKCASKTPDGLIKFPAA